MTDYKRICANCKWHETEYTPATIYDNEQYDSYCGAGIDDYSFETYENGTESEPCPLRSALEERDKWKAKAERYRAIALDHAAQPAGSHVDMIKQIEAVDGE